MAKIIFYYGTMDAGKSTLALQTHHSNKLTNKKGLLFTKQDRAGQGKIKSRLGLSEDATEVTDDFNFLDFLQNQTIKYIICDEVQFYSPKQIEQLGIVADELNINVYCFGLLTDFRTLLFPASKKLVEIADRIEKIQVRSLCWCGRIAVHNARIVDEKMTLKGETVVVGDANIGEVSYRILCRNHHRKKMIGK
jgi:thymidine kinase